MTQPSATPSATASSTAPAGGGGRVTPVVAPPETVACDADVPSDAGEPKRQYPPAPAVEDTIDPEATYTATIETSCGTVVLELFADVAPQAVASFVFLAEEGFFDGLTFHRILPGFVIQGGDPLGDGTGGPGYQFVNETDRTHTFEREGLLAMANSGPDTNGSQFFITLGPRAASRRRLHDLRRGHRGDGCGPGDRRRAPGGPGAGTARGGRLHRVGDDRGDRRLTASDDGAR